MERLKEAISRAADIVGVAAASFILENEQIQKKRASELDSREVALNTREADLVKRESAVSQVRNLLAEERTKVKAGLDREKKLDEKLQKCRSDLGEANSKLTKIKSCFPKLFEEAK